MTNKVLDSLGFSALHLLCFFSMSFIGGIVIMLLENNSLSFVDALFTSFSGVTSTGLLTVNFQELNTSTKIVALLLSQCGALTLWTIVPVIIRRRFLIKQFSDLVISQKHFETILEVDPDTTEEDDISFQLSIPNTDAEVYEPIPLYKYSLEFWSMTRLVFLILFYILFFYTFAFICLSLRFAFSSAAREKADVVGGWAWFSFFHVLSAFNGTGLSLFSSSLSIFHDDFFILIPIIILVIAGQGGFPILLRVLVYIKFKTSKFSPVYKFLLDHGREVYTHLFSRVETLSLLFWFAVFFFSHFGAFVWLDFDNLPGEVASVKILNAVFASFMTRTCGLSSFDYDVLSPSVLMVTILLMILAPVPFISILRSSSKKVKSTADPEKGFKSALNLIWRTQTEELWIRDVFWTYLSLFIVTTSIGYNADVVFFRSLFEVASAYGTVGLSIGHPDPLVNTSFAGFLPSVGKVCIMITMLFARQRRLPSCVDKSVTTHTFKGCPEDCLQLLSHETLGKMGIRSRQLNISSNGFALDPKLEELLQNNGNSSNSVTFFAPYMTFPPKRIVKKRDLMDLQRFKVDPVEKPCLEPPNVDKRGRPSADKAHQHVSVKDLFPECGRRSTPLPLAETEEDFV
ncbi:hypothetical protein P9112_009153 [Eukaryota sp. TZLM1-RC]